MWSRYPCGGLGRALTAKQEKQKASRERCSRRELTYVWRKF